MRPVSSFARAGTVALVGVGLFQPAAAQDQCGAEYRVVQGDTLAGIAERCGTTVQALMRANEQISDPSRVNIGWRLEVPGAANGGRNGGQVRDGLTPGEDGTAADRYEVQPGDTLYSIARAAGVTLAALLDANRGVDAYNLLVGQMLDLPGGTERPEDETRRVSVEGRVSQGVECPILTTPDGDVYTLTGGRVEFTSGEYVEVNGRTVGASICQQGTTLEVVSMDEAAPPAGGERVVYQGQVRSGTECPVIETTHGEIYALVSDEVEFTPGEYVEIEGEMAEASFCMQGQGTVDVDEIREFEAPPRDGNPDRAGGMNLDRGYVLAPWAVQGSSCARPDLEITGNAAGGQVVEASLNGSPRTGYVRLGPDPAFIFDQPRRVMALDALGPDRLTVMPPETGPVELGGVPIRGDGAVFIRC